MRHPSYYPHVSPIALFAFAIMVFWLFGFKLFFFIPLLFIFGALGMGRQCHMHPYDADWSGEKPKRKAKPKRDLVDDNADDAVYWV